MKKFSEITERYISKMSVESQNEFFRELIGELEEKYGRLVTVMTNLGYDVNEILREMEE